MLKYGLFYQFNAQISTFAAKKCLVQFLSTTLTSKRLAETDVKLSERCPDVIHESSLTPTCKTTFLCTGQSHGNSCRVCKKWLSSLFNSLICRILSSLLSLQREILFVEWAIKPQSELVQEQEDSHFYSIFEPAHEIMVLFALRKLVFQTCMRSHPVVLDVWFLVEPFIHFRALCVWTAKALARLSGRSGSPEPLLVANVISTIISWAGSFG